MLGELEARVANDGGAEDGEFAMARVEIAPRLKHREQRVEGVLQDVGDQRVGGPIVAGSAGGGAGLGDRVAIAEKLVIDFKYFWCCRGAADLAQAVAHGAISLSLWD